MPICLDSFRNRIYIEASEGPMIQQAVQQSRQRGCNLLRARRGGMREWLKRAVLKTAVPERVPGVRIPLPPPYSLSYTENLAAPEFPKFSPSNRTGEATPRNWFASSVPFSLDKCVSRNTFLLVMDNVVREYDGLTGMESLLTRALDSVRPVRQKREMHGDAEAPCRRR